MKERPILMCGEMVQAVLDGRKTQTRRIVKPRHEIGVISGAAAEPGHAIESWGGPPCPHGQPGDRLWVKETHFRWGKWVKAGKTKKGNQAWRFKAMEPNLKTVLYVAGEPVALPEKVKRTEIAWRKRPSIFMPRRASRIALEIGGVRVERVQEISEIDAMAEGVNWQDNAGLARFTAKKLYQELWDSLNKARGYGWEKNPWVWVLTFRKL